MKKKVLIVLLNVMINSLFAAAHEPMPAHEVGVPGEGLVDPVLGDRGSRQLEDPVREHELGNSRDEGVGTSIGGQEHGPVFGGDTGAVPGDVLYHDQGSLPGGQDTAILPGQPSVKPGDAVVVTQNPSMMPQEGATATITGADLQPGSAEPVNSAVREQVAQQVETLLRKSIEVMFAKDKNQSDVEAVLNQFDVLSQSEHLTEGEQDGLQQMKQEFSDHVDREAAQIATLENMETAYKEGILTKNDVDGLLAELKENLQSEHVEDKIAFIEIKIALMNQASDPVGSLVKMKDASGKLASKALGKLFSESAQPMQEIEADLANYSPAKDSMIEKQFKELAKSYAATERLVQDASDTYNLLVQEATSGDKQPAFVVQRDGQIDTAATKQQVASLMSTQGLSDAAQSSIANALLGGKGGIDAPKTLPSGFKIELKRVEVENNVQQLELLLQQDAPSWLSDLTVADDGSVQTSQGPLTSQQKTELVQAWLTKVERPSFLDMDREALQIIAKAKEVSTEGGSQPLRDLGQEFSSDYLFNNFTELLNGQYTPLTDAQRTAMFNAFNEEMTKIGTGTTALEMSSRMTEYFQKLEELYAQFVEKQKGT